MKIRILDGHSVIGGNKILVESKSGQTLILDFGKNFSQYSQYFEEFLTPRSGAGIHDFWKLNLIPHLKGLYREELLYYVIDEVVNAPSIEPIATFISHGHVDHFGYLSFLREDIPVISTRITYDIIKSYQDTGSQTMLDEFCSVSKIALVNGAKEQKLKKDSTQTTQRKFLFPTFDFESIGDFRYRVFNVDHSVLGASSIYIEVDGVKIAYTGDIRFHGKEAYATSAFFNFLRNNGVDILLVEGTRIDPETQVRLNEPQLGESDVKENALKVVKENNGKLVIADFGARHVERLEMFLEIAKESGRHLAITTKDAYLLNLLKNDGINIIDDSDIVIIESKREQNRKWNKEIRESDEFKDRLVTISEIGENQGDYIVCYSFWDMPNLLDIDIKGGAYIYSTSEAYTEEQMFDIHRLLNWIKTFNLKLYGIEFDSNGKFSFTREYHVSGHANPKDLLHHIEIANPRYVIPIHTQYVETYASLLKERLSDKPGIIYKEDRPGILTFSL